MAKRAKRGKAETFALPMAARVAIGVVAVAALGYGLLTRPASEQPARKPSAQEARASSTPVYVATPVRASAAVPAPAPAPIPAPAPAPLVEPPKAADGPGALVRQVIDYASHQAPGTVIIDTKNTFLYFVLNDRQALRYGIGVGREGFTCLPPRAQCAHRYFSRCLDSSADPHHHSRIAMNDGRTRPGVMNAAS